MGSSIISRNNKSILKWTPLDLDLNKGFLKIKKNTIKFNNGLGFNEYNVLRSYKDIKINKNSILILSDNILEEQIYETNKQISTKLNQGDEIWIKSSLMTYEDRPIDVSVVSSINDLILEERLYVNYTNNLVSERGVFYIQFLSDDVLKIKSSSNLFLTDSDGELKFLPERVDKDLNKFNYIKGGEFIYLYKYQTDFSYVATSFLDSNGNIVKIRFQEYYTYDRYSDLGEWFKLKLVLSPDASVSSNLIAIKNIQMSEFEIDNTDGYYIPTTSNGVNYAHNYLLHLPLQGSDFGSKTDIFPLKNLHTPTYEYTTSNTVRSDLAFGTNRIYDRIYSGTNEEGGYENIVLGYRSNIESISMFAGKLTQFQYSSYSEDTPVNLAGFIEDGAYAGPSPDLADCIFIQNSQIQDQNIRNVEPTNNVEKNYSWYCTWLYKTEEGDVQWLDRYYNTAAVNSKVASSQKVLLITRHEDNQDIYDVPSNLILKPGLLYNYKRLSKEDILNVLNQNETLKKNKILDIQTWNTKILKDESPANNNGIFYSTSQFIETPEKNFYVLNGKNHIIFPSNSIVNSNNQLSISIWMKSDNWNNLQGYQLFGNYYEGGIGLINQAAALAPIFTLIDANTGYVGHFNYKFKQTTAFNLFKIQQNLEPNKISVLGNLITIRMPDYTYWIFDSYNLIGHKYDANNSFITKVNRENYIIDIEYINQIEVDSKSNLYLYDNKNQKIICLNQNGKYLETIQIDDEDVQGIQIDLMDEIVYSKGYKSVIDNNNNLWESRGVNLYKNKRIHSSIGPIHALTCDYLNNIWILHGDDFITVINADTNNVVNNINSLHVFNRSKVIVNDCANKYSFAVRKRYINFIRIPQQSRSIYKECGSSELLDLAVVVDADLNMVSLMDLNVNQYYKMKVDDSNMFGQNARICAGGDFTNYQYQRKYANNLIEKNIAWRVRLDSPGAGNPLLLELKHPLTKLTPGWHHFVITLNCVEGRAKFFIDSKLVDSHFFDSNKYNVDYKYKSPLLVGATTIRDQTLNDIIGLESDYKFIGTVADLQIYKKSLEDNLIPFLYKKFKYSENMLNLNWNSKTGIRNFLEEITGWIKFKTPGIKSKYFNINIQNFERIDNKTKAEIETNIRDVISSMTPGHTDLHKINWL